MSAPLPGPTASRRHVLVIFLVLLLVMAVGAFFAFRSSYDSPDAASTPTATPSPSPSQIPTPTGVSTPSPSVRAERIDDAYVSDGQPYHKLDLFLPDNGAKAPYPLVIFIHGGGWRLGDKSAWSGGDSSLQADQTKKVLMENGFATASVNYRLYTEDTKSYPGNVHDIKAAIRYLRANAEVLGVDPNRFAIFGESAGGHLAQLMGTTGNVHTLDGQLGYGEVSSAVQAVVSYYGFSDVGARTQQQLAQGCTPDTKGFTSQGRMLGAEPDTTAEGKRLAKQASAITYLAPGDPPMLLVHGRQDCTSPVAQSENMAAALKKIGIPVELTLIDAGHAEPIFYTDPARQQQLVAFLQSYVK